MASQDKMNNAKDCGEAALITTGGYHYGPLGNIFFRPMTFAKKGAMVAGHTHNYDHVTFLWKGSVRLRAWHVSQEKDGKIEGIVTERSFQAPARILIKKDWCHEFTSLEDDTFADCIFALREAATGEIAEHFDGSLHPYE